MLDYQNSENWHPAANLFPLMSDTELQVLADDIKTNGQRNPIVLLEDKILDGRNRFIACKLVKVSPDFSRLADKIPSPTSWVLSQNLHRRHLTTTQRAFVGVEAEKLFAIEAKQRQSLGAQVRTKLPEPSKGRARDQAAKAVGVSSSYISEAKKITAEAPEVAARAKAGKISMAKAKKKLARGDTSKMVKLHAETAKKLYHGLVKKAYEVGIVSWAAFRGMVRVNDRYKVVLYLSKAEISGIPRRANLRRKHGA